jgi:hypothetical protein
LEDDRGAERNINWKISHRAAFAAGQANLSLLGLWIHAPAYFKDFSIGFDGDKTKQLWRDKRSLARSVDQSHPGTARTH